MLQLAKKRIFVAQHQLHYRTVNTSSTRLFASRPTYGGAAGDVNEKDLVAARQWLANFDPDTIPREACDVSFSRSSGPGGQNVNKVNSKATLRVPLDSLYQFVPTILHAEIRASRFHASKADALIIQADDSRKQNDNVHTCFKKLHNLIIEAGEKLVPGETSELQKTRVRTLQRKENESRLKAKKFHSSKKSSRRGDF
ncbi:peptidyl-tRNA hydrolase domain protein [Viridothelium virens]|uniref:Peptidyl-tRNA hydrolase domain protein n=1 Tax=Viridothelium virens TaxID=1048519 RepID=A0A6A6H6K6_VIRVR|nr:peptidyl-tRNA hydrolase domain protein [Viridothelium virens]